MKKFLLALVAFIFLLSYFFAAPRTFAAAANPHESAAAAPAGGPIYKYLILPKTGGPVACGDSLIPVYVGKRTGNTQEDVARALKGLFSNHSKQISGLYNPLYASRLKVSKVAYNPSNRNVTVKIKGKFVRPAEACERQRIRAVVWKTAQQFPEITHAIIFTPSQLLGDLLVGGK